MEEKPLSLSEKVSWAVQGVIRRWTFLLVVLGITAVCWSTRNPDVLTWWNLCASLLAIVIESIVGLAMFGQTQRDALVLRRILDLTQRTEKLEERAVTDLEKPHGISKTSPN